MRYDENAGDTHIVAFNEGQMIRVAIVTIPEEGESTEHARFELNIAQAFSTIETLQLAIQKAIEFARAQDTHETLIKLANYKGPEEATS